MLLDGALACAGRGLPVFPCEPRGKHPLGALAPHGFQNATLDEETIRRWWETAPEANVGIAMGPAADLFAVDVDPRKGGAEALAALEEAHGALPATLRARTGSGGEHIFFRFPAGREIRNSQSRLGRGLDVRGAGGYVIAAPSVHPDGGVYAWANAELPAEAPAWLVELAAPLPEPVGLPPPAPAPPSGPRRVDAMTRASAYLATMPPAISGSGGHDATWRAALALVRGFDLDPSSALVLLEREFNPRCQPPWPRKDLLHKVAQASRARLTSGYLLEDERRTWSAPPWPPPEEALLGEPPPEAFEDQGRAMGDDDEPYDPRGPAAALAGDALREFQRLQIHVEAGDPRELAGGFAVALAGAEEEIRSAKTKAHLRRLIDGAGQELGRGRVEAAVQALSAARELARELAQPGPGLFTAAEALESTDEIAFLSPALQLAPGRPPVCVGYAGDGKTTAALAAGLAWATGRDAWGLEALRPLYHPRVAYIDLDMGLAAAKIRVREVLRLEGRTAEDLEGAIFVGLDGRRRGLRLRCTGPRDIPTPADRTAYVTAWRTLFSEYDLAIVDNLRKLAPELNLDGDPRAAAPLDLLEEVSTETGGIPWVMAHSAKGLRGPLQALKGKADLEGAAGAISVIWKDEDSRRHFQLTRPVALRWQPLLGFLDLREEGLTLTPDEAAAFKPAAEAKRSRASPAERDASKRRADEEAAKGLVTLVVKAVNAARGDGLSSVEVRAAVGGTNTLIDKARLIALSESLIFDRKAGAYPRYYGPSFVPADAAQLPLNVAKPRR